MSIQEYARECARLFSSPETLRLEGKAAIADFEAQKSRFKVWAGNLGIFASDRASADFRLQNDPTARGLLTSLLTQLANKLRLPPDASQARIDKRHPGRNQEDSDSDSSIVSLIIEEETDSEAESDGRNDHHDTLHDIQEIISRLYRITSIIRRPGAGPKNERERVLRYVQNKDPPLDLSELQSHVEWQLSRLRENPQHRGQLPWSPLHNRLVDAALYRRQKLLYCQSHQEKLQRGVDGLFAVPQQHMLPNSNAPEAIVIPTVTDGEVVVGPKNDAKNGPAATQVGTEATAMQEVSPSTYAKSVVISGITASAVERRGELDIPPAPKSAAETQCPFCYHVIEDELRGRGTTRDHQWRRHVMKDLEPYVCLFDDCTLAYPYFKTTEEWIDHMRWTHTTRYSCQVVGHEDLFFETAIELEQHLLKEHEEAIPRHELQNVVKKGCRPSPDVFAHLCSFLNRALGAELGDILLCPLCDFSLSEIDDRANVVASNLAVMQFSEEVYAEIRDHVASHLERLALLSLPEKESVDAESSAKQVSHLTLEERVDDELAAVSLLFDDPPKGVLEATEVLPPASESWSELLRGWTFGHNCDYDPNSDPFIDHLIQSKLIPSDVKRLQTSDFSIAWICATPVEREAAVAVLDEIHPPLFHHDYDGNIYELGSIGPHNVVICSTASTVVDYLRFNFPEIKACLWVGIASGMPSRTTDIRLGDVVVSTPNESSPGVIQLDRGKTVADGGFARTAVLRGPSQTLLTAVDSLRALHTQHNSAIISVLSEIQGRQPGKWMPPPAVDELFDSTYEHVEGENCANCDRTKLVPRGLRNGPSPVVHYGLIASGSQVMKHGRTRDMLQKELGALCFGIGDAGLINDTQCLVIRGICDYADSHKNRAWQSFAAATAAAYAKELLSFVPPSIGDIEPVQFKMPPRIKRLQHEDYTIAWISPLPIERAAAEAMLDEIHAVPNGFTTNETDTNIYIWGCIGEHNLVIASLAPDVYKLAAVTLLSLVASLPSIRICLWVGIGSGIARPDKGRDIRLGDIVVGQPRGTVYHYDLVKASMGDECVQKSFIGLPPGLFLGALTRIKAAHEQKGSKVPIFLQEMLMKNPQMRKTPNQDPGYNHQGFENDRLFNASCDHISGPDCGGCDVGSEVQRGPRGTTRPEIHYGIIASGNTPVKDAFTRDRIVAEVGDNCICMETEAGTLISNFPCLMIRGICDYADSHKNDQWQRYASATAAAYAKELLAYMPAAEVAREVPISG